MTGTMGNEALAAPMFGEVPQTLSPNLRSMDDLYRGGDELPGWNPIPIYAVVGQRTGDNGAKLTERDSFPSQGTGISLFVYPVRPNTKPSVIEGNMGEETRLPMPPHTEAVTWIQQHTNLSEERVGAMLGVDRITIRNWKAGLPIKESNLRRVLGTKDVLERAIRHRQGNSQLMAWLETPDIELGVSPGRLLEQGDINRARLLAVMSPSSVAPLPDWARREVPAAWRGALEQPEQSGEFSDEFSQ